MTKSMALRQGEEERMGGRRDEKVREAYFPIPTKELYAEKRRKYLTFTHGLPRYLQLEVCAVGTVRTYPQ